MIDLPQAVIAALRDPLVVTLVVLSLGGLLTHFLFRRRPLRRAIVRVIFLAVLTLVLLYAGVVPYEPPTRTGVPFEDAVHAVLKIAWWLWTAWFLVGVLRVFVITERRPREGKLVQDLLAGLIYLAAVFAIIAYVFDLPIRGLLATSGVIAVILGLALQSTLSDVFSGIVLNFSSPYRPGDWISIDGNTDGRVVEMNWRATRVLTVKRDLAIVPNSTIANGSFSSLWRAAPPIMPPRRSGSVRSPGSSAPSISRFPRTRRVCHSPANGIRWGCAPRSVATWCLRTCSSPTTPRCCRPACSGQSITPFPTSS
jgi:small-conductance mechanosensitive channel